MEQQSTVKSNYLKMKLIRTHILESNSKEVINSKVIIKTSQLISLSKNRFFVIGSAQSLKKGRFHLFSIID